MARVYTDVQARIKMLSPRAEYVPCAAHSQNLIGSVAANSCVFAVYFFWPTSRIIYIFTGSIHRWQLYLSYTCFVLLQSLSNTQWSAKNDACRENDAFSKKIG